MNTSKLPMEDFWKPNRLPKTLSKFNFSLAVIFGPKFLALPYLGKTLSLDLMSIGRWRNFRFFVMELNSRNISNLTPPSFLPLQPFYPHQLTHTKNKHTIKTLNKKKILHSSNWFHSLKKKPPHSYFPPTAHFAQNQPTAQPILKKRRGKQKKVFSKGG